MYEEITLELARVERAALDAVRSKIASRQLGEAWAGLAEGAPGTPANSREYNSA